MCAKSNRLQCYLKNFADISIKFLNIILVCFIIYVYQRNHLLAYNIKSLLNIKRNDVLQFAQGVLKEAPINRN